MPVAVLYGAGVEHEALVAEVLHDHGVRLLDEHSRIGAAIGVELPPLVDGAEWHQVELPPDLEVLGAVAGSDVHQAGHVRLYGRRRNDAVDPLSVQLSLRRYLVLERGNVLDTYEVIALDDLQDLVLLPSFQLPYMLNERLQHDDRVVLLAPVIPYLGIAVVGVGSHRHVGRQCPGGGGPDEQ